MKPQFKPEVWLVARKPFNPRQWLHPINKEPKIHARNTQRETSTENDVEVILRRIENYKIDLTADYSDWRNLGFSFADEFGEAGRNYFHRLSRFHSDYNPAGTDRQFDKCLKGKRTGITIKSFFKAAQDAGISIRV